MLPLIRLRVCLHPVTRTCLSPHHPIMQTHTPETLECTLCNQLCSELIEAILKACFATAQCVCVCVCTQSVLSFMPHRGTTLVIVVQVDYTGFSTINAQRFGQKFVGKVANPHDTLLWHKAPVRKAKVCLASTTTAPGMAWHGYVMQLSASCILMALHPHSVHGPATCSCYCGRCAAGMTRLVDVFYMKSSPLATLFTVCTLI